MAHELGVVKRFLNRYGNWVLVGVTAALIVGLIVWYYHNRGKEQQAEERARYMRLRRAEPSEQLAGLIELAESAKSADIAARSAVDVGDLCAVRAHTPSADPAGAEARNWRDKAEKYYRLAIEKYPDIKLVVARAHFGLAVLAENEGDEKTAEAEYKQVLRVVHMAYPVAREARGNLESLKERLKPVRFATTTQASQPAATTQASQPAATAPATRPAPEPATATAPK